VYLNIERRDSKNMASAPMNFDGFLGPFDLRSEMSADAIDELINHLVDAKKIRAEDKDMVFAAVQKRETAMSTAIGYGIALPHGTTQLVSDFVAIVGRSRKGLWFGSLDGKLVNLVILFLVPPGQFQKHVEALADIAKKLHQKDFRDWLWDRLM
jgi:mannitol/fructose-specific phosphotransferase system IIA component (Ntr-type)